MARKTIMLPLVSLLAVMATAMPAVERSDEIFCPGDYLVEKWGYVLTLPSYNFTRGVGQFRGCASENVKRDPKYDTTVEISDAQFKENWYPDSSSSDGPTTAPHQTLIDRALEVCGDTYCDGTKSISTPSGYGQENTLVMTLDGEFADSTLRDNFISLVKEALDRSVVTKSELDGQIIEGTGAGFFNAVSGYGPASGYSLTVRVTNVDATQSCPDAVNLINSFGALVPELGTVFGVAGAICGAVSS